MISKSLNLFGFADSQVKEKFDSSMQLVDEMRVSPFLPIEKVSHNSKIYKDFIKNKNIIRRNTSWGIIEIRGRAILTQKHLELFSYIMAHKEEAKELKSGRVVIYFSLHNIAKKLEHEWGRTTQRHLEGLLKEIRDTTIGREDSKGNKDDYNILHKVGYSTKEEMWGIVLSDEYSHLFKHKLTIGYKDHLDEIRHIKGKGAGLIKSVIHFFITHDNTKQHRFTLLQVLNTIGYPTEERQVRYAVTYLNNYKDNLENFNIYFYPKDRILEYTGKNNIHFIPALPVIK